jgi:8-oxo-dGTP pyrophosphatase MutT (NUDIX family)
VEDVMRNEALEKATCFITRLYNGKKQLLLFKHPNAGMQIPAGTVELNEKIEIAALREAYEETGLNSFKEVHFIGRQENRLSGNRLAIVRTASVYERPDPSSKEWTNIRRGLQVYENRREASFVQVTYQEEDCYPNPRYISFELKGWVHQSCVSDFVVRSFYHLTVENNEQEEWIQQADGHAFKLFWADIDNLPEIVEPQLKWWTFVSQTLCYNF